jgi:putative acetyltransferase
MPTIIRAELPGDDAGIRRVLQAAFPTPAEAQLIDDLRRGGRLSISLVAEDGRDIVGHIAFSPVTIDGRAVGLGLGPLAVMPSSQRQGIGSALIRAGLEACRQTRTGFLVVLGDPVYYGRFGFQSAVRWRLCDEFHGGEAFQALELRPDGIPADGGLVRYAPEFAVFG